MVSTGVDEAGRSRSSSGAEVEEGANCVLVCSGICSVVLVEEVVDELRVSG